MRRLSRTLLGVLFLGTLMTLLAVSCSDDSTNSAPTEIRVTPETMYREVPYQIQPRAQWVRVTSTTRDEVSYSASVVGGSGWVSLYNIINGQSPDSFLISLQVGNLQAGTYNDTVRVDSPEAANSPALIPVTLVVTNILEVSPDNFAFAITAGGGNPPDQQLVVDGVSSSPVDLTLSYNSSWLSLSTSATVTPDTIDVSVLSASLPAGLYYDTITIDAPTAEAQVSVPCSLVVASWLARPVPDARDLRDVYFSSQNVGFIAGVLADASGGGIILSTTDGGLVWDEGVFDQAFGDLDFVGDSYGFAAGGRHLYRTRDGGATPWIRQLVGLTTDTINALDFVDTTHGWLVGKQGRVYRTADGGATFDSMASNTTADLRAVQFVSPATGWIVGNSGIILFSDDGGLSWIQQPWGGTADLADLYFLNELSGWIVGEDGLILHTADGGLTWAIATTPTLQSLNAIFVSPGGRAWAVGGGGTILYSTDGESWGQQPSGVTGRLKGVYFMDENIGWIVGDGGTVLYTVGGGL